ncbi:MAG: GNAT family N-acetyltransferase [Anaerolineales bacterium]|nr:GNAT family N-acetyltransferase [Anaerolineales bacterium]
MYTISMHLIPLSHAQLTSLKPRFFPDRPGPLIGLHAIQTGHGHAWADRWPDPRVLLTETAGNYSLSGDPDALTPDALRPLISGFVEAPDTFVRLLRTAFPDLIRWPRVIYALPGPPHYNDPPGFVIRRLGVEDARPLANLSEESNWIYKTWYGAENLAKSGHAWGAFADGQLVSVANTFFVGARYEDLGVITELGFRGRGLSVACAGAMCTDVIARGRIPSWSTSTDNLASMRVAEKLGFQFERWDVLYVANFDVPEAGP